MIGLGIIIGDWGYAVAAVLFTMLAIATSRQETQGPRGAARQETKGPRGAGDASAQRTLVVALTVTALWALYAVVARSIVGLPSFSGGVAETARNCAWLIVSWRLLRGGVHGGLTVGEGSGKGADVLPEGARPVYVMLLVALGCQLCLDMVVGDGSGRSEAAMSLLHASWLLRAATALGAIFLLHGLYARLDPDSSRAVGWLGCALTIMWAYEFNHYVLAWFSDGRAIAIGQMRGVVMTLIAPLVLLGTSQRERRGITLSRRATYRTVAIGLALLYAIALLAGIVMIRVTDDPAIQIMQLGAVFALSVLALMLAPSPPFRAWLRVQIARHLFTHRYDYRQEWTRFADMLGADETLCPKRAARAVAQVVSSPGALLLLRSEDGSLRPQAEWHWPEAAALSHIVDVPLAERLEATGWIIDMRSPADPLFNMLPRWMAVDLAAWTLVPLIHRGTLTGAVLLASPPGRQGVDWEDIDMLRVLARQLAITLS
ncbi:MAG: GAF domain-containing protein, partial [Sphingobium sp.]